MSLTLKLREPADFRRLTPDLLRLMQSSEMLSSTFRWFSATEDGPSITGSATQQVDRVMSIVAGMGWGFETVKLLKCLTKRMKEDMVKTEVLKDGQDLFPLWKECTAPKWSPQLERLRRVRNKCFAHWDAKRARRFLTRHAHDTNFPPLLQSDSHRGDYLDCSYSLAHWAILEEVFELSSEGELRTQITETADLLGQLVQLITHFITHICQAQGVHVDIQTGPGATA